MKLLSVIPVLLLCAGMATATPIRPDIRKMVETPQPSVKFAPARAGWNGSETTPVASDDRTDAHLTGTARELGLQEEMFQLVTPDWRVFLGLAMLIFLLRLLRQRTTPVRVAASYPIPVDAIEPHRQRPAA